MTCLKHDAPHAPPTARCCRHLALLVRSRFLPTAATKSLWHAGAAVMEVAGDEKLALVDIARHDHPTARSGLRAARMEDAAGRRIERVREREAEPGVGDSEAGLRREHGGKQRLGVGMA